MLPHQPRGRPHHQPLSQGVPIYERYFVGGINNIRGFQPFSLGPGHPSRSRRRRTSPLLAASTSAATCSSSCNTEIEFPIFAAVQIKGVVFFDVGNAYNLETRRTARRQNSCRASPEVFNPCYRRIRRSRNLRYSVGFGFRWFSPIGPLRFEWGIPLNTQPGEDPIVFEFTIGNFF